VADPRFGEELERAWDAVLRGDSASGHVDPALVETMHRLQALNHVPPPDPAFVSQVREELMRTTTLPIALTARSSFLPNGRVLSRPRSVALPIPSTPSHRGRWSLPQVATAALLLLVLAGSFFLFGPSRPGRHEEAPIVAPALVGTPASTPDAGGAIEPLAVGVADEVPAEPALLGMYRATYRPGGRAGLELAKGPNLLFVESGTMTYQADRPLVVTREVMGTAAGTQEEIPADTVFELHSGDSVVVPLGAKISRRNDGTEPAVELGAMLEGTFLGSVGAASSSGMTDTPIVTFHISDPHRLPTAPVTITLSQRTLSPGARFSPPAAAWWMVGVTEAAYPNIEQQPDGAALNTSADPVELYLTTVESSPGGTPVP